MNLDRQKIDWNSSDALLQIVKSIEAPLASIIDANQKLSILKLTTLHNKPSDIIFSSSQEIAKLMEEVVKIAKLKYGLKDKPMIFELYNTNENIQSMCKQKINPKRISEQDTTWLIKMEKEVYKGIDHKELNLYDLSYYMSVSVRQLHRKINNLLYLTPNKYIRVLKLHRAKQHIDNYVYDTVSQISYAVGYYDTHYFSKLFNQQYGIFPKELLNTIK